MKCDEVRALLSEYEDGLLDNETKMNIQKHLQVCPDCEKEEKEFRKILKELNDIEDVKIPEIFEKRLHRALCEEGMQIRNANSEAAVYDIKKKKSKNYRRIASIAAVFCIGLFSVILYNNNSDEFNNNILKTMENDSSKQTAISESRMEENESPETGTVMDKSYTQPSAKEAPEYKEGASDDRKGDAGAESYVNETAEEASPENNLDNGVCLFRNSENFNDSEQTGAEEYLKQLEALIPESYEVLSYEYDEEQQVWTFHIEINAEAAGDKEVKEYVVYCGKDGALWKKEL